MAARTIFAFDPEDSDETRSEKFTIFLVAACCCVAGVMWAVMYYVIFGFGLVTSLPVAFFLIVGISLVVSHLTRNHYYAVYTQLICIIYITTFIQWSIGGVFDSGFVLAWAFCGPIIALMFFSLRQSLAWLTLYLVNIILTVIFDDFFAAYGHEVPNHVRTFFFVMNLSVSSLVVFVFASYFVSNAIKERENANRLLLNILPQRIARTLKSHEGTIADKYDEATVLFADIVNFTAYSSKLPPDVLVAKLNEVFFRFDELTDQYGLEKIKTIGDAYMVAGGVPDASSDHTAAVARLALDMLSAIKSIEIEGGSAFSLRIGIHTGPVVAGVIGKSKFTYDLWGDTVNVASRMESSGLPNSIQVTDEVYRILKDEFRFEDRGSVDIKGKGMMRTYFLKCAA